MVLVRVVISALVALFWAVTLAPARTAPEGSVTRPVKLAMFTCAIAVVETVNSARPRQKAIERLVITHPLEKVRITHQETSPKRA